MELEHVYRFIAAHPDQFIDDLRKVVRVPSLSIQPGGTRQCAELIVEMMKAVGIAAATIETDWQPFVF